jgi:hypothetical protein
MRVVFIVIVRQRGDAGGFFERANIEAIVAPGSAGRLDRLPFLEVVDQFTNQIFEAMWIKIVEVNGRVRARDMWFSRSHSNPCPNFLKLDTRGRRSGNF